MNYRHVIISIAIIAAAALSSCGKKGKGESPAPAPSAASAETAPPAAKTATVTAGPLNLRADAGLNGDVIGRVGEGEKVVVLEKSAAAETIDGRAAYWYKVETIDKKQGWVFGGYLDIGAEDTATTETAASAATAEAAADAPLAPINVAAVADVNGWGGRDYYDRAKELAAQKEFGEAVFYFKAATEASPQTGRYWLDFGLALQELGRHAEAATAYERAVTLMPDDFWAHNNLGLACIRARRPRRAVEVLEKALTLEPKGTSDAAAAKAVARRNLAAAYELNGQPEKAAALR